MHFFILAFLVLFFNFAQSSPILKEGTIIRDAEIETILESYIHPIFQKANLNPKDLNLVLLVNNETNAAATLNTTMILNTGFLMKTERLEEVVGVIAHEVGHMEGQHIVRSISSIERAQKASLLTGAVGIVLGILTQRPDLAAALAFGSSISGIYAFLRYSRAEEASADQAAIRYLNGLCWPATGLVTFFKKLLGQELLSTSLQDPYMRSHPLTRDRMNAIETQIQNSCSKPFPTAMVNNYEILKTKLEAFLLPPPFVLKKFSDASILSQYARAIALYRSAKVKDAMAILDQLLLTYPNPAFIHELMGQIYYENGKIDLSITAYRKALRIKKTELLFKLGLAQCLIEKNTSSTIKEAETLLEDIKSAEPKNLTIWHFLSVVYGRQKKMGAMALALAEKAIILGDWDHAADQVKRALHFLKKGSVLYLRAQDLEIETEREKNSATRTKTL